MKETRFKAAVFLFILCPIFCFAQENSNNSLLWRISGNGLNGSSYLFGTIHLNDARVFNLGDSLYGAIANTDGFAMELDPQQLTLYLIDEMKKELTNPKKLSAMRSGMNKAKVAVARKLADIMHPMWLTGEEFRWSNTMNDTAHEEVPAV